MTDNLDGTHSYTFSEIQIDGPITISVLLYRSGGVYGEYWTNTAWSGANQRNEIIYPFNLNWGGGTNSPTGIGTDAFSGKYYFKIIGPTSGSVTFYMDSDNRSRFYIDGPEVLTADCCVQASQAYTMVKNQIYD